MQVLEVKSRKTTAEITAEADEYSGLVDVQLPFTPGGWKTADDAECGQGIVIVSADGDSFIGEVNDTEPDRCMITAELR